MLENKLITKVLKLEVDNDINSKLNEVNLLNATRESSLTLTYKHCFHKVS